MNRVLCFGGRFYADAPAVDAALTALRAAWGDFLIINGGARGADTLCGRWGLERGMPVIQMDAPWTYCERQGRKRMAGSIRNQWMLDHCSPTHGVGFPGNSGTRDMLHRLDAAGVPVWRPYQS